MMRSRAFTLIEVLMAFAAGSILIGIIYFFHFGLIKTWNRTSDKLDLNSIAGIVLDTFARDLRMTYRISELRPDHLILQRFPSEPVQSWEGFGLDNLQLTTWEYLFRKEGERSVFIRRQGIGDVGRPLFDVANARKDIFTGYVLNLPRDKGDPFPRFNVFKTEDQSPAELKRVTLMRIHLNLKAGTDQVDLVSKIFLPIIYGNVLQPDWNVE